MPGSSLGPARPYPCSMTEAQRKADHLRIAAGDGVVHTRGTGLDRVRLRHRAVPERALAAVGLETRLLGRELAAPLLISAMTGGTAEAETINGRLIQAAADHGLGLVLGSGRRLLDDRRLLPTYRPRNSTRPPLLLANLGAAQIRGARGADRAAQLVEVLGADGLSVHLNPLQEAVQPEGEPDFSGVLEGIAAVAAAIAPRPLVVKEVGFGLDGADVAALRQAGVAAVDVAGAGGTNWALIEGRRDPLAGSVAAAFADWGSPTAEALAAARAAAPGLPVIASGGLRDGVEVAKCLALGAAACGIARPLLIAAQADRAGAALDTLLKQLRIATWLAGAPRASALAAAHLSDPDQRA
jgi:isopentenyl-diphosphate delta-isomerase